MPGGSEFFGSCIQIYDSNTNTMMQHHPNNNFSDSTETLVGRGSSTGSPSSSLDQLPVSYPMAMNGANGMNHMAGGHDGHGSGSVEDASKSFPLVLHAIVSDSLSDPCIHWLPCGTRFVISEKDDFSSIILPRYFGGRGGSTTKFTSFTRRLKRWNFSRVPSGREMGAYFHENFRRDDPEMAKNIMYPVSKSQGLGGKDKDKEASGGGKGGVKKPPSIPKARRRASTGSILPGNAPSSSRPRTQQLKMSDVVDLLDISPTPIKGTIKPMNTGGILPMPTLENDMKNWLSSANFMENEGDPSSTSNQTPSIVSSSSSYFVPPSAFPSNVVSGTFHPVDEGPCNGEELMDMEPNMMLRPAVAMRRHSTTSTTLDNLSAMNNLSVSNNAHALMTSSQHIGTHINSFSASPLLGTQLVCTPEVPMSSLPLPNNYVPMRAHSNHNNMNFANPDVLSPAITEVRNTPIVQTNKQHPQPPITGSGVEELQQQQHPFSFSRECSFDDLKMVDPFT